MTNCKFFEIEKDLDLHNVIQKIKKKQTKLDHKQLGTFGFLNHMQKEEVKTWRHNSEEKTSLSTVGWCSIVAARNKYKYQSNNNIV
jgi:hypothetical protein